MEFLIGIPFRISLGYLSSFPALADRNLVLVNLDIDLDRAVLAGSILALFVGKIDLEISLRSDVREMLGSHVGAVSGKVDRIRIIRFVVVLSLVELTNAL